MTKKNDIIFMQCAINEAQKNIRTISGGPFGACIVRKGEVIAAAHNTVLKNDATAHAEINAIRKASKKLGTFDLSGCTIYSTTEPCPMCFSAIHWARIKKIVYGTSISDACKVGFNELVISNKKLISLGKLATELVPHFMRSECQALFDAWSLSQHKRLY